MDWLTAATPRAESTKREKSLVGVGKPELTGVRLAASLEALLIEGSAGSRRTALLPVLNGFIKESVRFSNTHGGKHHPRKENHEKILF